MGLKGSTTIGIRAWFNDLTYAEVHAMTLGAIQGAGAVAALELGYQQVGVALIVAAFALMGWVATDRTKRAPGVARIVNRLPASLRRQVRQEPHYYGGVFILAAIASFIVVTIGLV